MGKIILNKMEDIIRYYQICRKVCLNDCFKSNCNHYFCSKCITNYFIIKISKLNKINLIECPECKLIFLEEDILNFIENIEILKNLYHWIKLENKCNIIPCPFKNCDSYAIYKNNQKSQDIITENIINNNDNKIINSENVSFKENQNDLNDIKLFINDNISIILKCENNHTFCSKCLKPYHGENKCYDGKLFYPKKYLFK